jgi:hypothetical protein
MQQRRGLRRVNPSFSAPTQPSADASNASAHLASSCCAQNCARRVVLALDKMDTVVIRYANDNIIPRVCCQAVTGLSATAAYPKPQAKTGGGDNGACEPPCGRLE